MDFLAPKLCPGCGRAVLSAEEEMCAECLEECAMLPERRCPRCGGPADGLLDECRQCQLEDEDRPWRLAVSAFPFEGKARHWIHQFKYRGGLHLAPFWRKALRMRGEHMVATSHWTESYLCRCIGFAA